MFQKTITQIPRRRENEDEKKGTTNNTIRSKSLPPLLPECAEVTIDLQVALNIVYNIIKNDRPLG